MKTTSNIRVLLFGLVIGFPAQALAQELTFNPMLTHSCLEDATTPAERVACIGVSANACMEETEGGYSTVGMGGCIDRELAWWDDRLNSSYRDLRAREKADDAEFGAGENGIPAKAPALKAMQRAWITWRDATCDYERSQWGGGTGGGPATLGCLMRLTAEQTLYLERVGQEF